MFRGLAHFVSKHNLTINATGRLYILAIAPCMDTKLVNTVVCEGEQEGGRSYCLGLCVHRCNGNVCGDLEITTNCLVYAV